MEAWPLTAAKAGREGSKGDHLVAERLMTHEERQALINKPVSFFTRYQSDIRWSGTAIEGHPLPRRLKTPTDQEIDPNDEPEDE